MSAVRGRPRSPQDLHVADRPARERLRDQLVAARVSRGLSQAQVARLAGWQFQFVSVFEGKPGVGCLLSTFIRYAAPVEHRVRIEPVGVPNYHDTPTAAVYEALGTDSYLAMAVLDRLITARRTTLTQVEMGRRMGVRATSICAQEKLCSDQSTVSWIQRYTRAQGGELLLHLVPADAAAECVA